MEIHQHKESLRVILVSYMCNVIVSFVKTPFFKIYSHFCERLLGWIDSVSTWHYCSTTVLDWISATLLHDACHFLLITDTALHSHNLHNTGRLQQHIYDPMTLFGEDLTFIRSRKWTSSWTTSLEYLRSVTNVQSCTTKQVFVNLNFSFNFSARHSKNDF